MKRKNVILEKSFNLSLKIIEVYKYHVSEKHEFVMAKQLLWVGTSIVANCNEAIKL